MRSYVVTKCTNSDRAIVVAIEEQLMLLLHKGFHVMSMIDVDGVDLAFDV